jgi:chromodomain-containing protein
LNYGEHPSTPLSNMIPNIDDVPQAADAIQKIQEVLTTARDKMEAAQRRQAHYANSSRSEKTFNVGDRVWLRTANYMDRMRKHVASNRATSLKLLPRYLGPLEIIHKYSDLVYKLKLPAAWNAIHDVFHVSQLQAYRESNKYKHQQQPPKAGPEVVKHALSGEVVRAIIGRKYYGHTQENGHQYKYYVKWRDQPDSSDQWVLPDTIKRYGKRHPLLNKYDKEVPFIEDEPEPGSHTQLTGTQKQVLYDRGNVSTGMTVAGNEIHSTRKQTRRIPRKQY